LALAIICKNVAMIAELAKKGKRMRQKIVKNSPEIQPTFMLFLCHMSVLLGEDEGRKAHGCYLRKIRDVSYIAACGEIREKLCIS